MQAEGTQTLASKQGHSAFRLSALFNMSLGSGDSVQEAAAELGGWSE